MRYLALLEKAFDLYANNFKKIIFFLLLYYPLLILSIILVVSPLIIFLLSQNIFFIATYLLIMCIAILFIYSFFEASLYTLITKCVRKKKICIADLFKEGKKSTFTYLKAFLVYHLILLVPTVILLFSLFIMLAPYLFSYHPSLPTSFTSEVLSINKSYFYPALFLFVVFLIVHIYLRIRLLFYAPYIFLRGRSSLNSIKDSLKLTSTNLKVTFFFFVLLFAVNSVLGLFSSISFILGIILSFFTIVYSKLLLFLGFLEIEKISRKKRK